MVGSKEVVPYDRGKEDRPRVDRPRPLHLAGDGLCAEICPQIFFMHDDGLAYVREVGDSGMEGGEPKLKMAQGLANVPDNLLEAVVEAADECPGECIFIEP